MVANSARVELASERSRGPARRKGRTAARQPDRMDEAAFQAFYERTARPLWAYVVRTTGDPTLAEDLVQEAFYRFLRSGFTGTGPEHRKNYLYRIATNLMRDRLRSRRPLSSANRLEELTEGSTVTPPERAGTELRTDLARLLGHLEPRERRLLWLAHAEGLAHREVAEILGVRAASVRVMLFRARKKLAGLLREHGLTPEVMS